MSPRLTHARIDAPHLADGLFRMTRGREDRGRNAIVSAKWQDLTITFACVEPLGVLDQSVLLALVARAGLGGKRISASGKSARSRNLHAALEPKNGAEHRDAVMVETSVAELVSDCDLSKSGNSYTLVRAALRRLERVIVEVRMDDGSKPPSTLLLRTAQNGDGSKIDVALNYRIREALISTGFTRISLTERRALKTDVARLVHAFLSRWMRRGTTREISIDSLAKHVWGDSLGSDKSTRRDRKAAVRRAVTEIVSTGAWSAIEADGAFSLSRRGGVQTTHRARKRRVAESPVKSGVSSQFAPAHSMAL